MNTRARFQKLLKRPGGTWSILGGGNQSLYRDWDGNLYIADHSACDASGCIKYFDACVVSYSEAMAWIRRHSNWRNPAVPLHYHGIMPPATPGKVKR